ncbi:MAG TPA: hypothetical protein VF186_00330 [Gaiellaceae bacterium]
MTFEHETTHRELAAFRREYHCPACGYGAVATVPPSPCPMCGTDGSLETGEQRTRAHLTLRRLGPSTVLITPTTALDREAGMELGEAVAEHVHDQPEVVVDLTKVATVEDDIGELLVRLGALARAAGGRLLTVCPAAGPDGFALHEVDPDLWLEDDPIEGPLGRTLNRLSRAARRAREGEQA